jgi:anti-anti-sigma factor
MPNVLIIEDSPTQAQKFALMLQDAGFQVETAGTLQDGLGRITKGGIDALLLDLTLPDSEGLKTFLTARSTVPDVPLVVLTNLDDESLAAVTLQQGAQDYLVKSEVNQNWLVRSVQHAMARRVPQTQAAKKKEPKADPSSKQVLDVSMDGAVAVVHFLEKRLLDAGDIAYIGEKLVKIVESGCRKMLISFASVDYVSNGALSALLAVRRKMSTLKGTLVLCELSDSVREHLSVRQLNKVFEIRTSESSALETLKAE